MPEERPRRTPNRNGRERRRGPAGGMQLLAVQSVACVVILLIALLMRFIGGGAFDQLRQSFNQAMMDNSVINTLASLFGPLSGGDSSSPESRRRGGCFRTVLTGCSLAGRRLHTERRGIGE